MSCHTFPTTSLLKTLRELLPPLGENRAPWCGHMAWPSSPWPTGLASICPSLPFLYNWSHRWILV